MDRREFLKTAGAASVTLMASKAGSQTVGEQSLKPPKKIRGVNLGGWLVLERWITPTLYRGIDSEDEYTLCQRLGPDKAAEKLKGHRESWIVADDFKWLASRGINAVRLPVGYGVLENNPPFVTARGTLDWAFRTAKENGLAVLLDLHGVPGSQNGWDHSGRAGTLAWHTSKENVNHSLRIVEGLAEFCKGYENLLGIELLNEPRVDVPQEILESYYSEAYGRVRRHLKPERASVIFHDSFRAKSWSSFMQTPEWENVMMDTHLYQCFSDADKQRDIRKQLELAVMQRKDELDEVRQTHRCIVGEWSCSLPAKSLRGLHGLEFDAALRAYGSAQLLSYDSTDGWFFWTYRTERGGEWCFRSCIERGWLPASFRD